MVTAFVILLLGWFADGKDPPLLTAPFQQADAEKARVDWAKRLGIPVRNQLDLGTGVSLELMLIPPGKFRMGLTREEREVIEKQWGITVKGESAREVVISRPFYLAATETTQAQLEAVLGKSRNLAWFSPRGGGKNQVKGLDTSQFPAERVDWHDAKDFCDELNLLLKKSFVIRLPTEAEWEYACRAGSVSLFHYGAELGEQHANRYGIIRTSSVKSYPANAFGLYDMHGNVWEWCEDYYAENTTDLPRKDPVRLSKVGKSLRVLRGGGWDSAVVHCRSASRRFAVPEKRDNAFGFRICMSLPN